MKKTSVKIAVQTKGKDIPGWPHINFDYDKELSRIMDPIRSVNPDIAFDVVKYTSLADAERDWENDRKKYDGILVLLMTNWLKIDAFYARKAAETGMPVIIADVPFCGSGTMLSQTSALIRTEGLPVPMIASHDYMEIASAVKIFRVLDRMRHSRILVIRNEVEEDLEAAASEKWGCEFIHRNADDLMREFSGTDDEEAKKIADKWTAEALGVIEPSTSDIFESAKLYLAIMNLKKQCQADAVTIACLELSYNDVYGKHRHMYPCLSYYQMNGDGQIGVCEADINSTVSSMLALYLTGRPGYVSDPVVDTVSGEIIYAHCVACRKVFGSDDSRTCQYYIRSHAEDKMGASVQIIFPAGEKLTTFNVENDKNRAEIHSAVSVGNAGGDAGCRSKLVASCNADKLLENWMPQWHRVTVFGDYRRLLCCLFKIKGMEIVEEDR